MKCVYLSLWNTFVEMSLSYLMEYIYWNAFILAYRKVVSFLVIPPRRKCLSGFQTDCKGTDLFTRNSIQAKIDNYNFCCNWGYYVLVYLTDYQLFRCKCITVPQQMTFWKLSVQSDFCFAQFLRDGVGGDGWSSGKSGKFSKKV